MKQLSTALIKVFLSVLLIGGVLLTIRGQTDRLIGRCGLNYLTAANEAYLEESIQYSLQTFGVLSSLKAGLAVIEGSEVGMGFGLQLGDVVQAAYDYVDIAWRTVLAGGVILMGTRYLLQATALTDQWLLSATLAGFLFLLWMPNSRPILWKLRRGLRDTCLLLAILTVALYALLPVAVNGGAYFSDRITAPLITEAHKGLSQVQQTLFPEQKETASDDSGILARWSQMKERLVTITHQLKERTADLIMWILKLITGYLFDCIVFPVLLLVMLVWATRSAAGYLFGQRRYEHFRDDLQFLLSQYGSGVKYENKP